MRVVKFPYQKYGFIKSPIIPIEIYNGKNWRNVWVYVDSGAFNSILHAKEAVRLGVDYRQGRIIYNTAADGGAIPVYLHKMPIKIGSIKIIASIGFSEKLGINFNLLGRKDIFNQFNITFRDQQNEIIFQKI